MFENLRKIEKKEGISLIVLIVTIGVMIILASVILVSVNDSIDDASIVAFAEDLSKLEDSVETYNLINDAFPTETPNEVALSQGNVINIVPADVRGDFTQELEINGDLETDSSLGVYYKIDLSKIDVESSTRGMKKSGDADIYVVSAKTMTVYYLKGETIRGETYFSLSSKISNYAQNVVTNNGNLSGEGIIAQTVGSITVTKLKKTWTNKMGITVSTYMNAGETLHVKAAGSSTEMEITTVANQNNVISFNKLADIDSSYSTQDTALNSKRGSEKYIEVYKKKSGTTVDTVKVDLSNYEVASPNISSMTYTQATNGEGNTVNIKVSDEESGVKEIRYDYLQKYDAEGQLVDYYNGVKGTTAKLDAEYLKVRGHKAQVASDGTAKLTIPFNVQRIQVLAVDNAGNWQSKEQSITYEDDSALYINAELISITKYGVTFKIVMRDINKNIIYTEHLYNIKISTDGVNYTNDNNKKMNFSDYVYAEDITDYETGYNITDYVWIKVEDSVQDGSRIFKFNLNDKATVEEKSIDATEVASNPEKYYGKEVTNYTESSGSGVKWKIFYSDRANIYLIADDYIPYDSIPYSTKDGSPTAHKPNRGSTDYEAYFIDISDDYTGSASITEEKIQKLNSKYFEYLTTNGKTSASDNMKAVAYMLDTEAWKNFKGENADYAIGCPTNEIFINSYKQMHEDSQLEYQVSDEFGYKYRNGSSGSWINYIESVVFNPDDPLYVITDNSKATSMWLASPSGAGAPNVVGVNYDGAMNIPYCNSTNIGFRPLVCLNSSVKLEEQNSGEYTIK